MKKLVYFFLIILLLLSESLLAMIENTHNRDAYIKHDDWRVTQDQGEKNKSKKARKGKAVQSQQHRNYTGVTVEQALVALQYKR